MARCRRNGNLSDASVPGAAVPNRRLEIAQDLREVLLQDVPLQQQHRTAQNCATRYSSSCGVEKVLSGAATPPASAVPKTDDRNSARLVIRIADPLAFAEATGDQRFRHFDTNDPADRGRTSAPSCRRGDVAPALPGPRNALATWRMKPERVSSPSPGSCDSGMPRTIDIGRDASPLSTATQPR